MESTDERELKMQVTEKLCEAIEDEFGRLKSTPVKNSEFTKDRMQITEKVINSHHINESMGYTFIDLIRNYTRKG